MKRRTTVEKTILQMRDVHKRFPGVYALKGANLDVRAGEVHALVGENGSGKSTLVKVLGGIYEKDQGTIIVDDKELVMSDALESRDAGVSIIHQELALIPYLSVAENIFLNREPLIHGSIDFKKIYEDAQRFVDEIGLNIDVRQKVVRLSIAEQQMVEIAKAVSFNAKIIAMDEPTSSLSDREIDALFANIKKLKERGIGIIYISHRLSELHQIVDRVTILRDGETITTVNVSDTSDDEIVKLMVGREVVNYYTRTFNQPGEVRLAVENISSNKVHDVSFEVRAGEILGFAGLVGAGRSETMKAILGLDAKTAGKVFINGMEVDIRRPSDAYALGVGYIPENRREEGIIPLQTVRFNMSLKVMDQFIKPFKTDFKKEEELTNRYIEKLRVKTASQLTRLQNLSGGNQQKVIIGSWMATEPTILIMDEPTRGIDVGAKSEIYALMNELAKSGIAIVMISSELPELINMSDRIIVMRDRTISKELDKSEATQEEIMKYAVNI